MKPDKIRAGIVGGAGYTGGETLRLLLHHPAVEIRLVHSRSNGGQPVYQVHKDLIGETELVFTNELDTTAVDVLFLCLGHGESKVFLEQNAISESVKIIDLSQDFRLHGSASVGNRKFVYGLPEVNREAIKTAGNIANPGCFATAMQLSLLPLAAKGLLHDVHMTGITGSTGAGQKLQDSSHFSWRVNNIQAYKSLSHQHLNEVQETIKSLQPEFQNLHFIPWRGDFARGIYITAYTAFPGSLEEALELYQAYYQSHLFTVVSKQMIDMKQAVNTNKCLLSLEKANGQLVIHAALDNLLKGAAGQAVQNMNLMCGLAEDAGLRLKSIAF